MKSYLLAGLGLASILATGCNEQMCKSIGDDPVKLEMRDGTLEDVAEAYCDQSIVISRINSCEYEVASKRGCSAKIEYTLENVKATGEPDGKSLIGILYQFRPFEEEWGPGQVYKEEKIAKKAKTAAVKPCKFKVGKKCLYR